MNITIKAFATVKDILGFDQCELSVASHASIRDVHELLSQQHEGLGEKKASLFYAVNEEYSDLDRILKPGDVLAIFPPVSGG